LPLTQTTSTSWSLPFNGTIRLLSHPTGIKKLGKVCIRRKIGKECRFLYYEEGIFIFLPGLLHDQHLHHLMGDLAAIIKVNHHVINPVGGISQPASDQGINLSACGRGEVVILINLSESQGEYLQFYLLGALVQKVAHVNGRTILDGIWINPSHTRCRSRDRGLGRGRVVRGSGRGSGGGSDCGGPSRRRGIGTRKGLGRSEGRRDRPSPCIR